GLGGLALGGGLRLAPAERRAIGTAPLTASTRALRHQSGLGRSAVALCSFGSERGRRPLPTPRESWTARGDLDPPPAHQHADEAKFRPRMPELATRLADVLVRDSHPLR